MGQIILFLTTIYIARKFGPDDFGNYNFTMAIVSYFLIISDFGLGNIGVIHLSQNRDSITNTVNRIQSLKIALAIVTFGLLVVTTIFLPFNNQKKSMLILNGLLILTSGLGLDWVFNGLQKMVCIALTNIIRNLWGALSLIVLLFFWKNIIFVPISWASAALIGNLFLLAIYFKRTREFPKPDYDFSALKLIIIQSLPFFASGVFAKLNCNIDTVMLGFFRSDYEVGVYNSVYKIVNALVGFIGLVFAPVYPKLIAGFHEHNIGRLELISDNMRKITFVLAIPLFFIGFFLNRELILFLYGKQYLEAVNVFAWLFIYAGVLYIRELYGFQLSAWGMQKQYLKIVTCSSFVNIVTNLIFIPGYGIVAAAINTLISELINYVWMARTIRKKVKLQFNNTYLPRVLTSSVLMSLAIISAKHITQNGLFLSLIGLSVYLPGLFFTKAISWHEVRNLLIRG